MNREFRAEVRRGDGSILATGWDRVDLTTDPLHFEMTLTPIEYTRYPNQFRLRLDTFPTNEELRRLRSQIGDLTQALAISEAQLRNR